MGGQRADVVATTITGEHRQAAGGKSVATCYPAPGGLRPDPQLGQPDSCQAADAPAATLQAHPAPLGLRFYDGAGFPEAVRGDLFVALHGGAA